jgi:glycosyltransferase involved in cell wall biosynthesis
MKVTVIMPIYNGEKYLYEAINSILQQDFEDFELLLLDDASTDKSSEIAQSFQNQKIRFLQQTQNKGLVASRNTGIAEAKGEYITWLDHDDYAMPNKLAIQTAFLDQNPNIALVGAYTEYIDENGKTLFQIKPKTNTEILPSYLLFQNCFQQCTVMLRKTALEFPQKLAYREEFVTAEDYDLWVRIAQNHQVANLPIILAKHRRHTQNTSLRLANTQEQNIRKILAYQIANLQILATETELSLHRQLSHYKVPIHIENYQAIADWLTKLKYANRQTNSYPSIYFEKILVEIWQKTSGQYFSFGTKALRIFSKCNLTKDIDFLARMRTYLNFSLLSYIRRKMKV